MIDPTLCDKRLPAKWQTSMAVFKFRPEEEFQLFPKYNITYLKITATITGYQPLDKEIQGSINWHDVNVATIPGITDLLTSYNPCHGAILQVVVGPVNPKSKIPLGKYPFFMDFEPKKRELYELATDTHEKQSRSIESLNITKSGGSTQSLEVLDVDMGGGGFGGQVSAFGTGAGFNYSAPNGQWGTKRLNAEESLSSRSSDVGQEKRETFSFSAQISQMYHLLDSYHLGTNRAVFFMQPRPHTLEEPSGFVKGPRPVEGIQEFFMVVAQLKDQNDFCVSLRLDTSHLTKTPIMDYERKVDQSEMASANAPIATESDTMAERKKWGKACTWTPWSGKKCWDMYYQCYTTNVIDDKVYQAPPGFVIEGVSDLVNDASHGSSSVTVTPDGSSLSIHAEAKGHNCFEDTWGCVDCPDTWQSHPGHARRQVQINLVSTEPTKQVGEEDELMITTRGLCCCEFTLAVKPMDEYVVSVNPIGRGGGVITTAYPTETTILAPGLDRGSSENISNMSEEKHGNENIICKSCADAKNISANAKYTIRQANELSNYIKTETIRSLNDPTVKLQKFVDTDFFSRQLQLRLIQSKKGREILNQSILKDLPKQALPKLKRCFKKEINKITRHDFLTLQTDQLIEILGKKLEEVQRFKLVLLGVKFNPSKASKSNDTNGER